MAKKVKKENPKEVLVKVSDSTTIRVGLDNYKGVNRFDIRKMLTTEKYTGLTKDGCGAPVEFLDNIISALQTLKATVVAEGIKNEPKDDEEEEA